MNKKIYYIPIEPLEERYTEQWYRWFPEKFKEHNYDVEIIDGESLTNVVETGTFLDINSTLHYKSEQLKKISKLFYLNKINNGDIFFVADIEFWGIESIKYLSVLNDIDVKLYGFCHAASYTKEDFMEKTSRFAKYFEKGWFSAFDKIFVGSYYHKNQILKLRNIDENDLNSKIIVSGNPTNSKEILKSVKKIKKKKQIILTNRPDNEKRPQETLMMFEILKKKYPDWDFIVTTSRKQWGKGFIREYGLSLQEKGIIKIYENISKKKYYKLLSESYLMISNSIEENFGYCIVEAMILRTIPILRNDFSHLELIPEYMHNSVLFNNLNEELELIENFIKSYDNSWPLIKTIQKNIQKNIKQYDNVIEEIILNF